MCHVAPHDARHDGRHDVKPLMAMGAGWSPELEARCEELREQVGRLEEEVAVARSRAREERINLEARVEEVEESRVGERERRW